MLKYLVFINGKCDKAVKLLKLSAPAAASWHSTLLGEVKCANCAKGVTCTLMYTYLYFDLNMHMKKQHSPLLGELYCTVL